MKWEGNLSFGSVKGPKGLTDEFLWLYKDSLYIDSCSKLSTTATSRRRQLPLERVPNGQDNLSTMASFSASDEKVQNGHEI